VKKCGAEFIGTFALVLALSCPSLPRARARIRSWLFSTAQKLLAAKLRKFSETPRETVCLRPQYRENPSRMPDLAGETPPYPGLPIGVVSW
jgi:hypothetical protein